MTSPNESLATTPTLVEQLLSTKLASTLSLICGRRRLPYLGTSRRGISTFLPIFNSLSFDARGELSLGMAGRVRRPVIIHKASWVRNKLFPLSKVKSLHKGQVFLWCIFIYSTNISVNDDQIWSGCVHRHNTKRENNYIIQVMHWEENELFSPHLINFVWETQSSPTPSMVILLYFQLRNDTKFFVAMSPALSIYWRNISTKNRWCQ